MENKINKYKNKKNLIFNKIKIILNEKKNNYKNILNSINNINPINKILDKINNNINIELTFFIITGIYGVGKTTIIQYLEKNFGIFNIKLIIDIKNIDDILNFKNNGVIYNNNEIFFINNILSHSGIVLDNGIILCECDTELVDNIIEILNLKKYYIINVIPKDNISYKNKLINKIFFDLKFNTNYFKDNINLILTKINNNTIIDINNLINFNNSSVLLDNNFDFIDKYLDQLIKYSENIIFKYDYVNLVKYYFN